MEETKKAENRRTIIIFVILAILTGVEFWLALNLASPAVPLIIVALLKAALIVQYFMHIYRLRREEEHA